MAELEKLAIRGIRSFSPEAEQVSVRVKGEELSQFTRPF